MDISWNNVFKIVAGFYLSAGGAASIIIGLSKWFGDFLSQRLLYNYTQKHEKELEEIKSKYSKDLEETKNDLLKARSQFLRYSEKQFNSYNNLWKVLIQTKRLTEQLWNNPTPEKVKAFAEQIRLTKYAVEDEQLLIEDRHLEQLLNLIQGFENFELGKTKLVEVLNTEKAVLPTQKEVEETTQKNKAIKKKYELLITQIGKNFREQIRG
jgi:hypothetical protein